MFIRQPRSLKWYTKDKMGKKQRLDLYVGLRDMKAYLLQRMGVLKGFRKKTVREDGFVLTSVTLFSLAFTGLIVVLILNTNLNMRLLDENNKRQAVLLEQTNRAQLATQEAWANKLSEYQIKTQSDVNHLKVIYVPLDVGSALEQDRMTYGVKEKQVNLYALP